MGNTVWWQYNFCRAIKVSVVSHAGRSARRGDNRKCTLGIKQDPKSVLCEHTCIPHPSLWCFSPCFVSLWFFSLRFFPSGFSVFFLRFTFFFLFLLSQVTLLFASLLTLNSYSDPTLPTSLITGISQQVLWKHFLRLLYFILCLPSFSSFSTKCTSPCLAVAL